MHYETIETPLSLFTFWRTPSPDYSYRPLDLDQEAQNEAPGAAAHLRLRTMAMIASAPHCASTITPASPVPNTS